MTDSPTTEAVEESSADEPKGLRKQLGEAHAKIKKLEAKELKSSLETIGLTPDKELGKAIAKGYDGEMTTEAITEYAKDEYGYEPPTQGDQTHRTITDEQAKLDEVSATAGSVTAPTSDEALQKAEVDGDYRTTMAMKGNIVAQQIANQTR